MRNVTWKDEAVEALKELGGIAHIDDIYKKIVERNKLDMTNSKTPRRTLSRVLQTYSYSTDYGTENIFYSVYGVEARKGIWGLVDTTLDQMGLHFEIDDEMFSEGKQTLRQHLIRERNPRLIKIAKKEFKKEHDGKLYCEVCGFDFFAKYGELGADFIEAHHIKPISEMKDGEKTNVNDIVMLCSNCHRMIHRKKPWLRRSQLITILNGK